MTLLEIEETLYDLQSRHAGLNESLLVTLLRGGGWEEKNIQEAILLFRSGGIKQVNKGRSAPEIEAFPSLQTKSVFMPQVDGEHLLVEHNNPPPEEVVESSSSVPQSLVESSSEPTLSKKEEFPHNLPLRPFETSDHIWPFARYRDVFYGDIELKEKIKPVEPQAKVSLTADGQTNVEKVKAVQEKEETAASQSAEEGPVRIVVPVQNDDKLVILACIMLVAILLLLGYMYSNGRI